MLIRQAFEHPILAHYLGPCLLFSHKLQDSYCFQQLKAIDKALAKLLLVSRLTSKFSGQEGF